MVILILSFILYSVAQLPSATDETVVCKQQATERAESGRRVFPVGTHRLFVLPRSAAAGALPSASPSFYQAAAAARPLQSDARVLSAPSASPLRGLVTKVRARASAGRSAPARCSGRRRPPAPPPSALPALQIRRSRLCFFAVALSDLLFPLSRRPRDSPACRWLGSVFGLSQDADAPPPPATLAKVRLRTRRRARARRRRARAPGDDDYDDEASGRRRRLRQRWSPCPGTAGGPGETSPGPGACPRGPREQAAAAAAMETPPQEAPPGPGADGDAEEAAGEAGSPSPASPPADGRLKAAAKRVTFPSDEDIVSGAVEPKDPWRHAQNVTVDEVISAYKQACQKLSCRQIPKLLRQLQEFTDLGHRIDCLDLKGEKLDYKTCEALEEVFKRLQFKVVDLEQTNLDEDGASALFDMIEYYESATHLNISFNKHIGTRGWQAAAHMMRKTSCLQYLDARNTPLLDHSAPFVARALRIRSSLAVLHLENASLSGRPLMLLATALKMNVSLRELHLADNKLNGLQDSAQLGTLLKFNCSLQILDLRNNHVLDSGLAYICEGLKEQRKGLVTLVLWNNQLTHTGMAFLGMTLPHTQSLETLNLGHNPIGNEGVRNLKNGLISNRSVLRLGLASTKLTCEGAVAVAEFIAESPRLLRLDLRENEIKTGGLMALSLALKVNHSLLRLDLDREPKKEAVKSFIETQKALLAEIQNGCKRNFVLAREREEKEQRLQLSASMPEITVTEPPPAPAAAQNGAPGPAPGPDSDSDSDSEGEDEEEDGERDEAGRDQSPSAPCPALVPPTDSLGPGDRSPPGSPSSPSEQRISVSSPGRGHKVFVVTRVESPPERAEPPVPPAPLSPPSPPSSPVLPPAEGGGGQDPGSPEPQPQPETPQPGPLLPNGLKPEFALALPPEPPPGPEAKAGSRSLDHELSCPESEKELEKLLLEASQEPGQETL